MAAIALIALIAIVGGRYINRAPAGQGSQSAANPPQNAPNLSQMTPQEITDRLFDRVMMLYESGQQDSARFLALNMAIPAFELHDSLNADLRYDLGRIAEVSGVTDVAKAQADTILREKPTHLLGLALASRLARAAGESTAARGYDQRLLAAEKSERALRLREYENHKTDLDSALARARRGGQ